MLKTKATAAKAICHAPDNFIGIHGCVLDKRIAAWKVDQAVAVIQGKVPGYFSASFGRWRAKQYCRDIVTLAAS